MTDKKTQLAKLLYKAHREHANKTITDVELSHRVAAINKQGGNAITPNEILSSCMTNSDAWLEEDQRAEQERIKSIEEAKKQLS